MHVAFINPQGNFDPEDSYWTAHPDFGGQLVYVKELALAMGELGHEVDIVTRRIEDPDWPEFAAETDAYPGRSERPHPADPRAARTASCPRRSSGPTSGPSSCRTCSRSARREGSTPDLITSHYGDGGLCAVLIEEQTGIPFCFTAHSLGAQKMDKMGVRRRDVAEIDERYRLLQAPGGRTPLDEPLAR